MSRLTLAAIAAKMQDIDIAILSTKSDGGEIASRPMSNNADVEYDGDSYYFTKEPTRLVSDIEREPKVSLSFSGKPGLLGGAPHFFASVEGRAELIRDKARFEEHWNPDVEVWFAEGVDTPGLVLVKVHATRVKYWDGEDQGELEL